MSINERAKSHRRAQGAEPTREGSKNRSHVETVLLRHQEGFSCSQALLSTYGPLLGLERDNALRLSTGFAGGMSRMGETCGAVTGAIMLIGLKYGKVRANDEKAKEFTYFYVEEFVEAFLARNGSLVCRDLIHCDLSTLEGLKLAREEDRFHTICPKYVGDAAEIIEDLLF